MNRKVMSLFFCITLLFLPAIGRFDAKAGSTIIKVPENYPTIQAAINQAQPGDTIQVSSGTYYENLYINKTLTLIGAEKSSTLIVGTGHANSVVQVNFTTVSISGFTITNGTYGIMLETCTKSTIKDNNINGYSDGLWLFHSDNNTITDNLIFNCGYCGLVLCGHSSSNIVEGNTIRDNNQGIRLTGVANLIYHNNFVNNSNQIVIVDSFKNTWNNDFEGNYWSNLLDKDENQDGIRDVPYVMDGNNQDNYPLMGVFTQLQVTKDGQNYSVTIISNSTITNLYFDNSICLDVLELANNNTGFCRITLLRIFLNSDEKIHINGLLPIISNELPTSNSTHVCLYFAYIHPTAMTVIAPEALVLIGIAVIISVVVAVIVARKVRSGRKYIK
ncbi:MAG: right-handed parallel beta-helix repeat-containing protein [Candidatus Bathyarchaeota archaeon]|nr:right-handed parallel beta-helix repeat-containing protein [Candidatus Bathyarchaeota archaeon]